MSRWLTGITLKRYFGFTEHQMRKLRKEVGKRSEEQPKSPYDSPKWLYDLDKVLANHKPKTAIPHHLIKRDDLGETGMTCREARNGNCILKCKHTMPHKKNDECKAYCHRMKVKTVCIEVYFAGWDIDTFQSSCGKKVTADCKGDV